MTGGVVSSSSVISLGCVRIDILYKQEEERKKYLSMEKQTVVVIKSVLKIF